MFYNSVHTPMFQFGLNGDVPQFSPHADVPRQFSLNVPQFSPQTVVFRVQTKVPITPMFQLTREISFFLSFPFSVSLLSLSFSYPSCQARSTRHRRAEQNQFVLLFSHAATCALFGSSYDTRRGWPALVKWIRLLFQPSGYGFVFNHVLFTYSDITDRVTRA